MKCVECRRVIPYCILNGDNVEKLYICTIIYVYLHGNTTNIHYIGPAVHMLSPPARYSGSSLQRHYSLYVSGYGVKKSVSPVLYSGRFDIGIFIIWVLSLYLQVPITHLQKPTGPHHETPPGKSYFSTPEL